MKNSSHCLGLTRPLTFGMPENKMKFRGLKISQQAYWFLWGSFDFSLEKDYNMTYIFKSE